VRSRAERAEGDKPSKLGQELGKLGWFAGREPPKPDDDADKTPPPDAEAGE
jgi:hypothetical protein